MLKYFISIIILFWYSCANCQITIESKIANQIIKLNDNNSFQELDKVFKDKRIVILGEGSHFDGSSFETRVNLVNYLINKLNFDVLGLETFGFIESNVLIERSEEVIERKFNIIYTWSSLWAGTKECSPLVQSINENKIKVFGIDNSPGWFTINCMKTLFCDINKNYSDLINWDKLKEIHGNLFIPFLLPNSHIVSQSDELYFINSLTKMSNVCNQLKHSIGDKYPINLIEQGIKNLKSQFNEEKVTKSTKNIENDYEALIWKNNIRDAQMADNIIWYLDHNPDKKIIIWCANFHGARDISQSEYPKSPTAYARQKLMGEHLSEKYGDQLYSLAFTSSDGLYSAMDDTLEREIANKGIEYGFIDFSPLRFQNDYFDKPFKSRIIGHKSGKWMSIFDGIYFIKNQKKSTTINK